MSNAVTRVTFNRNSGDASAAREWIRALNDPRIVQEKAGFLFKVSFDDNHLMLAAAPCLINGERSYHYNQHLEKEDAFTLIGDVNAQGVFTILFNPESREQIAADSEKYIELFRRFAAFLFESGYTGDGPLDEVTQDVLKQLDLSPAPASLAELAG
jgi:hypothetical protein